MKTLLRPFSGKERHHCQTTRTGVPATPQCVQGAAEKEAAPHHKVSAKKKQD
jgi:hypothetical protein